MVGIPDGGLVGELVGMPVKVVGLADTVGGGVVGGWVEPPNIWVGANNLSDPTVGVAP